MSRWTRGRRKRTRIGGQFAAREIAMLESPAFRTLSLSARRVLDRLEIEFAHHGGTDNGLLPVTFDNFVDYGMDRHSVAPAIRELEALGFAKITTRGRAGNAEFRTPNKFRITYKHTNDANPTNEWKSIHTIELADELAKAARAPRPARSHAARNRKPVRENSQPCAENSHLAPVQDPLLLMVKNPHYFLYLGVGSWGRDLNQPVYGRGLKAMQRQSDDRANDCA